MNKYKFFVNDTFFERLESEFCTKNEIERWFSQHEKDLINLKKEFSKDVSFAELSERLLLEGKKDFFIWDDILKAAEMTFFQENTPLCSPSLDVCSGYAFWTSRVLHNIDVAVDLFPDDSAYKRTIEGFVQNSFINNTYNSVLQADVTQELPLPKNYFKSIVSVCALEHIEDIDSVLTNMYQLLHEDGRLFLSLQTDIYMNKFVEIFNDEYVRWVRTEFMLNKDRTYEEWRSILNDNGFVVETEKFVLSSDDIALKAMSYWKDPFNPILSGLNLEEAIKTIPEFRKYYYQQVKHWSKKEVRPEEAGIMCVVCRKK